MFGFHCCNLLFLRPHPANLKSTSTHIRKTSTTGPDQDGIHAIGGKRRVPLRLPSPTSRNRHHPRLCPPYALLAPTQHEHHLHTLHRRRPVCDTQEEGGKRGGGRLWTNPKEEGGGTSTGTSTIISPCCRGGSEGGEVGGRDKGREGELQGQINGGGE